MNQVIEQRKYVVWYALANASNSGNVYSNKTFHIVYSIFKHDIKRENKEIIGILYNEIYRDPFNLIYFSCNMPLKYNFDLEYLLSNVIYNPKHVNRYNPQIAKKKLMEDYEKKRLLEQCLYVLKTKVRIL